MKCEYRLEKTRLLNVEGCSSTLDRRGGKHFHGNMLNYILCTFDVLHQKRKMLLFLPHFTIKVSTFSILKTSSMFNFTC